MTNGDYFRSELVGKSYTGEGSGSFEKLEKPVRLKRKQLNK